MRWVYRSDYDADGWLSLLAAEIDADRPVYYTVHRPEGGGHAVVVDGYDSSGFVHVNWGWGGHSNGFYVPDVLYPGAGNADGYTYQALMGIMPDDGSPVAAQLALGDRVEFSSPPVPFHKLTLSVTVYNPYQLPFEGQLRLALCLADGSSRWLGDALPLSIPASSCLYPSFDFSLPSDAAGGSLRLMYCHGGDSTWHALSTLTGVGAVDMALPVHYPLASRCAVTVSRTASLVSLTFPSGTRAVLSRGGAALTSGFDLSDGSLVAGSGLFRGGAVQVTLSLGTETCSFLLHVSSSSF